MSPEYTGPKNLSGLESTPELAQASQIARNNGQEEGTFYTTLGHIVTKILEMDITITLPDRSEYKPFTTVGEVNTFFRITSEQYGVTPNPSIMDHFVSEIYRTKVAPLEQEILEPRREIIREFFIQNIWDNVEDIDTVDTLLTKIDELANMGIIEVTKEVCDELKEYILQNFYSESLATWYENNQEDRDEYTVEDLNKKECTDVFEQAIVDQPWRHHSDDLWRYLQDVIGPQIRALYKVDPKLIKSLGKANPSQFRNTRYL